MIISSKTLEKKPYLIRVEKTLDLVTKTLPDFEFAVVGSYAKTIVGEQVGKKFNIHSDLDVAVECESLEDIALRLFSNSVFYDIIETNDYHDGSPWPYPILVPDEDTPKPKEPKPPKPKKPQEYLLLSKNLTPIHLVGSYYPQLKDKSVIINGIRYLI